MNYFYIEPEVAGGWGKNTVFKRTPGMPTVVHKLHYEFSGWLGDELLESTPCFIVSQRMAHEINEAMLTGMLLDEVKVSTSDQFRELYPNRQFPQFLWFKIVGKAGVDDFGIATDGRLVVSEVALKVLQSVNCQHCDISDYPV